MLLCSGGPLLLPGRMPEGILSWSNGLALPGLACHSCGLGELLHLAGQSQRVVIAHISQVIWAKRPERAEGLV